MICPVTAQRVGVCVNCRRWWANRNIRLCQESGYTIRLASFNEKINNIYRACYSTSADFGVFARMSTETACAFCKLRVYDCNALLAGLPEANLDNLLSVRNTFFNAVVAGLHRRDHTTADIVDFHILPISAKINFKIAKIACKLCTCLLKSSVTTLYLGRLWRSSQEHCDCEYIVKANR